MLCMNTLFSVALLVPFVATSLLAEAARMDVRAARAECFRKANEAANASVPSTMSVGATRRKAGCWNGRLSRVLSQTRHNAVDD